MKKKLIALCLIIVMIAVAAIGGTLAYFTDSDAESNVFTMGSVEIDLSESNWTAPANTVPGVSYAKNPVVENTGTNDAWIRVDVTLSDATAFQVAANKYSLDIKSMFVNLNTTDWTCVSTIPDTTSDTLTFVFYYNTALTAGASTQELFTAVKIPGVFTNTDMEAICSKITPNDGKFTIDIQAHAIQTSDDYTTVADAFTAYGA